MDLRFSFSLIKEFFEDRFYLMIQKVFRGEPISKEILWSAFMAQIRDRFVKGSSSIDLVLKAHLLIRYFTHLGMIQHQSPQHSTFMETPPTTLSEGKKVFPKSFDREQLEIFIAENPEFFDQNYKKGVFAVGILVKLLLKIQSSVLSNNTPFEKKLKGLNVNHESLSGIYVEALNKLSQYKYKGSNFHLQVYAGLRDFISEYYTLESHRLAKISNNEISFYFVAGLEMGNKFRLEAEEITSDEAH
jgi:CRISPR-associated protein Csh1